MPLSRRAFAGACGVLPFLGCAPKEALRLAGHPWPGYETLFFAEAQKWLPKELNLQHHTTLKASIDALKAGTADAAMLTLDEVIALQAQGMSLKVILVFDVSKGADAILAKPTITSLPQLRGKTIGLEPSTLGEFMLAMVLDKAALKAEQVTLKRIPYEEQEAAWKSGQLDALITYEPIVGRLAASGASMLLSTRDLPDSVFDVLAVTASAAGRHAATLRATLQGHFRALTQLRLNPWDTAFRMAPHLGVPAEELINSLRGLELPDLVANRSYLGGDATHMVRVAESLSRIMRKAGVIRSAADADSLFTDAYLPTEST